MKKQIILDIELREKLFHITYFVRETDDTGQFRLIGDGWQDLLNGPELNAITEALRISDLVEKS